MAKPTVSAEHAQSPPSDNDGGERPVRKQLKETSIESTSQAGGNTRSSSGGRKRSIEESREDGAAVDPNENGLNQRKRSRECTPEDPKLSSESVKNEEANAGTASHNVSDPESTNPEVAPLLETIKDSDEATAPSEQDEDAPSGHPRDSEEDTNSSSGDSIDIVETDPASSGYSVDSDENDSVFSGDSTDDDSNDTASSGDSTDDHSDEDASSEDHTDSDENDDANSESQASEHEFPAIGRYQDASTSTAPRNVSDSEFESDSLEATNSPDTTLEEIQTTKIPEEQDAKIPADILPKDTQESHKANLKNDDDTNPISQDTDKSAAESTSGATTNPPDNADEAAKVPKKKRSREQLEDDSKGSGAVTTTEPKSAPLDEKATVEGEPEKKKHRDNSQERESKTDKAFAASAFGNASAASPFASLGAAKTKTTANEPSDADKTTSTSAFASSGLAAFAGSEKSPFGTLGASTPSVFKSASSTPSAFASASGSSGFSALGTGFAGVGGGFSGTARPGGLTSFASPNSPATFGESKAKPFGAEESEGEESDNNDDEEADTFEAEKTDERFFEQTIETGEEEEETAFTCKAKLFNFSNKEWKERGIGTFKVNVRRGPNGKRSGRMIMRADGAGRVMLNSPIFKGMNYGDPKGEAPSTKQILLGSTEDNRTVPLLLRTGNESLAKDLYSVIKDLLEEA
ncbi:hypothetical protein NUU61_009953 [Penicillium alfredii]|uniref:RanBD1 domain-containing protein n=1 Tax=Penicillium alfredii TaxID=1506179 RepID=A0A9W9JTQ2_9EURO|nr:uncharacterized protein NUU61_009953 [Penicillium alfredii]KAJ5081689.1 hypothetical protein NUU61_009953 [Penicillium alfredii]